MQQFGSALSFHLPPAAPPLILLALLPTKLKPMEMVTVPGVVDNINTNTASSMASSMATARTFLPNAIAKKLALASLGIAVLSWADYEVRKKKRLTPLPLVEQYKDIRKAVLPPFLPEQLPPIELDPVLGGSWSESESENENNGKGSGSDSDSGNGIIIREEEEEQTKIAEEVEKLQLFDAEGNFDVNIPALKRSIHKLYQAAAPKPQRVNTLIQSWKRMNRLRQREEADLKRRKIMDELLILQQLKKQKKRAFSLKMASQRITAPISNGYGYGYGSSNSTLIGSNISARQGPLGYALVTGASGGIGRALAVELARWGIPLILVARNVEKLSSVAAEIEAAYGVNCCVISADLSKPEVAKQVHKATEDAGLRVDILINNAGVCTNGDLIDGDEEDIANMINVNVGSVTNLSYLYGKDMKRQRRGRILFVSSVVGATPGGPGVAAYSATKAYEKSLAQSMGRELEKYGVGVTCLLPGAVKGTAFAKRSYAEDALCWKFPFYPMTAPNVAERGIRALLSGEAESIPGWHNRLFLKIVTPLLPQRLTTTAVGFSFSPLQIGNPLSPWKNVAANGDPMLDKYATTKPPPLLMLPPVKPTTKVDIEKDADMSIPSKEDADMTQDDSVIDKAVSSNDEETRQ